MQRCMTTSSGAKPPRLGRPSEHIAERVSIRGRLRRSFIFLRKRRELGEHRRLHPGLGRLTPRAPARPPDGADSTNAELLWDRAQLLRQLGRERDARAVLTQLAEGDWQPRFVPLRDRAKQELSL